MLRHHSPFAKSVSVIFLSPNTMLPENPQPVKHCPHPPFLPTDPWLPKSAVEAHAELSSSAPDHRIVVSGLADHEWIETSNAGARGFEVPSSRNTKGGSKCRKLCDDKI